MRDKFIHRYSGIDLEIIRVVIAPIVKTPIEQACRDVKEDA
jgi:uncharacterized protein with HEPN domain